MQARHMPGFLFCCTYCNCPTVPSGNYSRAQKQKIGSGCNFFSIADCRVTKKRRSWPKNAVKKLQNGPFSALREWKRVPNRKKVAETSGFLFLRWAEIAVTWQTSRKIRGVGSDGNGNGSGRGANPDLTGKPEPDGGTVPDLRWSRWWRGGPGACELHQRANFQFRRVAFCVCKTA